MNQNLQYKWDIVGNQDLLLNLEQILISQNLAQAILLRGQAGIGKFSILKRFAELLQNTEENKAVNLDTLILEDNGENLKIETIRQAKEFMQLSRQGNYKICIIKNVERMTTPASNSLLKILEEPPQKAIFLLSSSEPERLLDTIISRCRVFDCKPLIKPDLIKALQNKFPNLSTEELEYIVDHNALSLGQSIITLKNKEKYNTHTDLLKKMYQGLGITDLMLLAQDLAEKDRAENLEFLKLFLNYAHREARNESEIQNLSYIQKAINLIKQNANQRLTLEVLFLQFFAKLANV